MNIEIGLAGWGDHESIYPPGTPASRKLQLYSRQFPVVEVDSSFYAIPQAATVQRWAEDTADDFGFVVKANQAMTGHERGSGRKLPATVRPSEATAPGEEDAALFGAFRQAFEPMRASGKLRTVLFQYPPWFDCTRENVAVLRRAKELMDGWPVALEFRHQSWFAPDMRERTLRFMEREGWMHSVCDEPQAGSGSVPTVPVPTHPERTVVRFHGRNAEGWNSGGSPNWRNVRYLYDYSERELAEWIGILEKMSVSTGQICVIFNNNSGGHGAGNAKRFMSMLGLERGEPPPVQLDLFE
ncbi:DUF72 domain-containing protein [Paenibacillus thermotolerans]|uniref:DUF72 domain-containing protein n=1 Tax=Paenibacillus thermotolerans TaxID=3027807 RepID=UPI0023681D47|nr:MULTISPECIES: DUF72 domain-containing protein [unclassified Paenibacillus]